MDNLEIIIVVIIITACAFWAIRKMNTTFFKAKKNCSTCKGCPLAEECNSNKKTK